SLVLLLHRKRRHLYRLDARTNREEAAQLLEFPGRSAWPAFWTALHAEERLEALVVGTPHDLGLDSLAPRRCPDPGAPLVIRRQRLPRRHQHEGPQADPVAQAEADFLVERVRHLHSSRR